MSGERYPRNISRNREDRKTRKTWLNNITEWTELDIEWAATELIEKRRFMTDDAVKPWVEDGWLEGDTR